MRRTASRIALALAATIAVGVPGSGHATTAVAPPFGDAEATYRCPDYPAGAAPGTCTASATATAAGDMALDLEVSTLADGVAPGTSAATGRVQLTAKHTLAAPADQVMFDVTMRIDSAVASSTSAVASAISMLGDNPYRTVLDYEVSVFAPTCASCEGDSYAGTLVDAAGVSGPQSITGAEVTFPVGIYTFGDPIAAGTKVLIQLKFSGRAQLGTVDQGTSSLTFQGSIPRITAA